MRNLLHWEADWEGSVEEDPMEDPYLLMKETAQAVGWFLIKTAVVVGLITYGLHLGGIL